MVKIKLMTECNSVDYINIKIIKLENYSESYLTNVLNIVI